MKIVIDSLRNEFAFEFEEVNIESDKLLYEKYGEKIPVLMINGKMFAKYRVDENKLRMRLKSTKVF